MREKELFVTLGAGGVPVLRCGVVLGFRSVVLFGAAHVGGFPVVVRLFSQIENSLFAIGVVFASAMPLFSLLSTGVGFELVRGVSFSGRLKPGAMFVGRFDCAALLVRDETRRLVALAFPTEMTSVHLSSSMSIGVGVS